MPNVIVDRVDADTEICRDGFVTPSAYQKTENMAFSLC
jgi:hypothetical protein